MLWAVREDIAAQYERAIRGPAASVAQREAYASARERARAARSDGLPLCLTIAGDVAEICVDGLLTPQPDFWAWFVYGANTSYAEIVDALLQIEANTAVKRVQWDFNSPGGMVDGLLETLAVIETFSKPSVVTASLAASAAYALAAMAGKITAKSPASEFGNVGTLRTFFVDGPAAMESRVEITSTDAPNKRPDVRTPEGQAVVRAELDVLADLAADAIARGRSRAGRKTTKDEVNAEFGRGGAVYAEEARAKGMIDKVPPRKPRGATTASAEDSAPELAPEPVQAETPPAPIGAPKKAKFMNKDELKKDHPEVYASILAEGRATGVEQGTKDERDRVDAHLTMGEASGDMKTALESIRSGAVMTASLNAKYMAASMNRRDQQNRQSDSDEAGKTTGSAKPPAATGGTLLDTFAADLPQKKTA